MGTRIQIILYAENEIQARSRSEQGFQRVASLNRIMSDYDPESELMRLSRQAGGAAVPVSPDLFAVLARGNEIARLSEGAFDVSVGPVVRLWRRARRTGLMPDPEARHKALALLGYRAIQLDPVGKTVTLTRPGMQLDLGGIAKGYAVDAVHQVLRAGGITRALVAAGGDIAVSGAPPDAAGWRVQIALAPGERGEPPTLELKNAAVSTSGDAEQFVEIGGQRYAHIVDPRTGLGLTETWQATAIAADSTTADAWATALCILGPTKGMSALAGLGVQARFTRATPAGVECQATPRFPPFASPSKP